MKVHSIKNSVKSLTFGYSVKELCKIVSNKMAINPTDVESSAIDLVEYTSKNFTELFITEVNPLNIMTEMLTLSLEIRYFGTDSTYTIKDVIDMTDVLNITMWHSLELTSEERIKHLKAFISSRFVHLYNVFGNNFSTEYGIYLPDNHKNPIANECPKCGNNFDDGSIFENFLQQGKDGVEFYQVHPNDILINVEDSYSSPYRFSKILYVKEYLKNYSGKSRYYKCSECDTKQTYIEQI